MNTKHDEEWKENLREALTIQAAERYKSFEERLVIDGWCLYRLDENNFVVEPETGVRGGKSGQRAYFGNLEQAVLELYTKCTNELSLVSMEKFLLGMVELFDQVRGYLGLPEPKRGGEDPSLNSSQDTPGGMPEWVTEPVYQENAYA